MRKQLALVELIRVGHELLERRAGFAPELVRGEQAVLGRGDLAVDRGRREALGVDPELVAAAADQPPGVGLVVDRELARVAQARRLGAQDAGAGGVKGHQPHAARAGGRAHRQQPFDPAAHLLSGLVRERDREDLLGARLLGVDQEGDPVREHARLAAARAREDQQRTLAMRDGLALGLVQALEQTLDPIFLIGRQLARRARRVVLLEHEPSIGFVAEATSRSAQRRARERSADPPTSVSRRASAPAERLRLRVSPPRGWARAACAVA